jgi:hypothetical protein
MDSCTCSHLTPMYSWHEVPYQYVRANAMAIDVGAFTVNRTSPAIRPPAMVGAPKQPVSGHHWQVPRRCLG